MYGNEVLVRLSPELDSHMLPRQSRDMTDRFEVSPAVAGTGLMLGSSSAAKRTCAQ
jgi:hypothetical protein